MSEPQDAPAAIAPPDPTDRPPRFRWRVIPALLGMLYGATVTIMGVANVGAFVWLIGRGDWGPAAALPGLLTATTATVGGVLLTVGAVRLWRRGGRAAAFPCAGGAAALLAIGWFGVPMPLS